MKKAKKEIKNVKSKVTSASEKSGREEKEGIAKQLDEEIKSVTGMREFVNKGADALTARLLGGVDLYTDNMVESMRKRLTSAWEHSRILGEYLAELENVKSMMTRQVEAEKPIEPEVV